MDEEFREEFMEGLRAQVAEEEEERAAAEATKAIADSWRNTPECYRRQAGDGSVSALP